MNSDPIWGVNIGVTNWSQSILGEKLFIICQKKKLIQPYIRLIYGRNIIFYYYVNNLKNKIMCSKFFFEKDHSNLIK
jgi:hypothetical protein